MPKHMTHEPEIHEIHPETNAKAAERRREADDTPTECGLTREELRLLVVEMIG